MRVLAEGMPRGNTGTRRANTETPALVKRTDQIRAIVLGAGAGGGVPQWNCGCPICRLARRADPCVRRATQVGLAVTGNETEWLLIGASPDLREQILRTPDLWPRKGSRDSPIAGVVLTGADIDALLGLLVLREGHAFSIFAAPSILDVLAANSIFNALDPAIVRRVPLAPGQRVRIAGVSLSLLTMPGKVPLYQEEDRAAASAAAVPVYAALVETEDRAMVVAPACAEITETVRDKLAPADLVFFDATLFKDDEMIVAGLSGKTGRRMGHVSLSGTEGTIVRLGDLRGRRVLFHINNTNPVLVADSPARQAVEEAGFEVAFDGMEVRL